MLIFQGDLLGFFVLFDVGFGLGFCLFAFFQKTPHIRSTDYFFTFFHFQSYTINHCQHFTCIHTHTQTHTQATLFLGNWLFFQGIADIFNLFLKRSILKKT